jgi:hypothetical protein
LAGNVSRETLRDSGSNWQGVSKSEKERKYMVAYRLPPPGIYFRKGHFDDRLIDGLITVKISVALVTPLGVEEKEMIFTAADLLTAINTMLTVITNLGAGRGLEVVQTLGGTLPTPQQVRALEPSVLTPAAAE